MLQKYTFLMIQSVQRESGPLVISFQISLFYFHLNLRIFKVLIFLQYRLSQSPAKSFIWLNHHMRNLICIKKTSSKQKSLMYINKRTSYKMTFNHQMKLEVNLRTENQCLANLSSHIQIQKHLNSKLTGKAKLRVFFSSPNTSETEGESEYKTWFKFL